jgi:hypothetical protein
VINFDQTVAEDIGIVRASECVYVHIEPEPDMGRAVQGEELTT